MTLINIRRYRDIAITLFCFAGIVFVPFAYWQIKLSGEALRETLYAARNTVKESELAARELTKASNQIKLASFELRPQLKALIEDLNSSEQQRARLVTMRSGESFARAGEEASLAFQELREQVLPRYAALPKALVGEVSRAVDEVPSLAAEGRGVLIDTRETIQSVNALLAAPEVAALLPKVEALLDNVNATAAEARTISQELAKASGKSDAIAGQIEGVLIDARKSIQASERTLDAGTKTLNTVRKVTWLNVLISLGGLLR